MKFGHPWGKKHRHFDLIERWNDCQGWNYSPWHRGDGWNATLKNCRQRDGKPAKCDRDERQEFDYSDSATLYELIIVAHDKPIKKCWVNKKA